MTVLRKLAGIAAKAARVAAVEFTTGPADQAGAPLDLTREDRAYVEAWVGEETQRLRALSYEELVRHQGQDLHCQHPTPSGVYVMRETSVFWDDPDARTLRVFVDAIQLHSGWMPTSIAKDDFIRAPDGSFIDE